MLSSKLLIGLVLALCVLAVSAPLYLLLLARFPLVMLQGEWSLAGVRVDPTDLVLGFLLLAYALRGRRASDPQGRPRLPYLLPWLALGLFLTASYLSAPNNQEHLTSLHRAVYQLYRYCWKSILVFPLAMLLLDGRIKMERALVAVVLAGDLLALHATVQGYLLGTRSTGPLPHPNALAGALVAPFLLSLIGLLAPQTRFRLFWIASSALILRGLLFTGSRGGIVAALAGVAFCTFWLLTRRPSRRRLFKLAPAALIFGALLFWIKPDLLERPTIRRAMTAREGMGAQTMQWRLRERWPRFIETILENPWLGTGTPVDADLLQDGGAATPHNGYLAIAVANGLPAGVFYLMLALLALLNGLRMFARSSDPWESTLGLVLASALVAILVHNFADSTIRLDFVRDLFWLICALSARGALLVSTRAREVGGRAPAGALLHGMPHQ